MSSSEKKQRPRRALINPVFIGSFSEADLLPAHGPQGKLSPEIAFVGRSNAGKSMLISKLLNWKNIARSSKEPGKTVMLNLFHINNWLSLVDLPGYGYARVGLQEKLIWEREIPKYLTTRAQLSTVVMVIDARRNIEEEEAQIFAALARSSSVRSCIFVGTKIDKLSSSELQKVSHNFTQSVYTLCQQCGTDNIEAFAFLVSSTKGDGIAQLRQHIESFA